MADSTDLSGLAPLVSGLYDLFRGSGNQSAYNNFAQVADPFASQRGQYQTGLNTFMSNPANSAANSGNQAGIQSALARMTGLLDDPSSLTKMPGYQFGLDQSLEAVNRGAGASGLLNSGNRLTALQDRGQGYAQGWQQQIWNELLGNTNANIAAGQEGLQTQQQGFGQLASLAGVNAGNPAAAAALMAQGRQGTDNSVGSGIGGVTTGLSSLLPALQRMLSGGSGGSGLGGLDPGTVYGPGSGWGNDVIGGGGSAPPDFGLNNGDWNPDDFSWLMPD